jgi:hypothetical protein
MIAGETGIAPMVAILRLEGLICDGHTWRAWLVYRENFFFKEERR